MNFESQLSKLILSFYREDPEQFRQIRCLRSCRVSRRWRVLRIDCPTRAELKNLQPQLHLLQEPIAQLRIARKIRLMLRGQVIETVDVKPCESFPGSDRQDDADLFL